MSAPILHATAIAAWRDGAWRAALVRGPSGAGKSDLALRALAAGWRLVADDRVRAWASGGRLFGRAPETLAGRIEARGLGVVAAPALAWAPIGLVVDLTPSNPSIERTPEPDFTLVENVRLPRIDLWPYESSAVAKLTLALQAAPLGAAMEEAYQIVSHGRGRSARGAGGGLS